jgi:hypothetical protein
MNIITFLFYAGLFCFFAGIGIPYLELIIAVCAIVLAAKSI